LVLYIRFGQLRNVGRGKTRKPLGRNGSLAEGLLLGAGCQEFESPVLEQ